MLADGEHLGKKVQVVRSAGAECLGQSADQHHDSHYNKGGEIGNKNGCVAKLDELEIHDVFQCF